MEAKQACFKEFPNQCNGCPEYWESRQDQTERLIWMSSMGFGYPKPLIKIVKKCTAFHKRVVEFQK